MTDAELIEEFGGATALAKRIGISQQAVSKWKINGIPKYHRKHLEAGTPMHVTKAHRVGKVQYEDLVRKATSILESGEFATWLNQQHMPFAAAKELAEFERVYQTCKAGL